MRGQARHGPFSTVQAVQVDLKGKVKLGHVSKRTLPGAGQAAGDGKRDLGSIQKGYRTTLYSRKVKLR